LAARERIGAVVSMIAQSDPVEQCESLGDVGLRKAAKE